MENLEFTPNLTSKFKGFYELDRAEKGELLDLQQQKKRDEALKSIMRLKNCSPKSFAGLDMKDIDLKLLKPEDLDAYYESFIERKNGWYEKSEGFKAYKENISDYRKEKKLNPLNDPRLIFSGMIRQQVVKRTDSKIRGETIQ